MKNDARDREEEARLQKQTQREFGKLEAELRKTSPGVPELLQVYGGYEAAVRQAEAYLRILEPVPRFSTTDNSGSQDA